MEILERALEMEEDGINIVHMEIGEPDFDTPARIVDGCLSDIKSGKTHYTHSLGYLELREKISNYKYQTRETRFDPKTQIMVMGGTSPAFFNILSTLLNSGDEVLITDPGYPCYANFVSFFGGKPVFVPIYEKNEFDLDITSLEKAITQKTKALIINTLAVIIILIKHYSDVYEFSASKSTIRIKNSSHSFKVRFVRKT